MDSLFEHYKIFFLIIRTFNIIKGYITNEKLKYNNRVRIIFDKL